MPYDQGSQDQYQNRLHLEELHHSVLIEYVDTLGLGFVVMEFTFQRELLINSHE
ncbi:hypothetical protein A79_4193 [Vibrio parahaemolyticus AQ3810]|nr:hypothetical protein A79_4193 [Vibrio parahaemolyticus AQ3810]